MGRCAITGAAAGTGRALAERFGRGGFSVVAIDRDRRAGEAARFDLVRSGVDATFVHADVTLAADRARCLAALDAGPPVDVFVHDAGIRCVGPFERSELAHQRAVLELNLLAPMLLSAELLRGPRLSERSTLVFVSSLARFVGYPGAAAYAASKEGIASYARSLAALGIGRGLHVLTVYPGPTRTEHPRRHAPEDAGESRRMPPEALAERVWRAVRRRRRVLVPGLANRAIAVLGHALPGAAERVMRRALHERFPGADGG